MIDSWTEQPCSGCDAYRLGVKPRPEHAHDGEDAPRLCRACADSPDGRSEPPEDAVRIDDPPEYLASVGESWKPVELTEVVRAVEAGEQVGPAPSLMPRTDGPALLYPGEVHSLAGEPEAGKGWIVLAEVVRLIGGGHNVVYIDGEDSPATIVTRLMALGAAGASITAHFHYVRPEDGPADSAIAALTACLPSLVVLDGQTELYGLAGLDPYSNGDVPQFLREMARPFADAGAAVVLVDHVVKDAKARGRFAIGGQHKLAGIAAAYGVEVIDRPSRRDVGRVKLIVHKDRHGHVRQHAAGSTVALVTITPEDDGAQVTVEVGPPDSVDAEGVFRPTNLMERLSRFVEANPGSSQRAILDGTTGNRDWRIRALGVLEGEGWITTRKSGKATAHESVRPFREDDDTGTVPTVPTPFPSVPTEHSVPTVPTVPTPYKGGTGDGNGPSLTTPTDPMGSVPADEDDTLLAEVMRRVKEET